MRLAALALFCLLPVSTFAEQVVLAVRNMTCSLCAVTVRKSLERVPGVTGVAVSYEKKTATVTFEPRKASMGSLVQATTQAGFPSSARR